MKAASSLVTVKRWLTTALVLLWVGCAGAGATLDEELIQAVQHEDTALVASLLEKPSSANTRDQNGITVLMWAVWTGNPKSVALLLDKGADVNAKTSEGMTALLMAAARGHQIKGPWYHEFWTSFKTIRKYGRWGPTYPSGHLDQEIIKLLVKKGADVNAKDEMGWTALKRARRRGAPEIV